ncbi:MAG: hypothetical protein HYS21_03180 [Deltaproteobacteria bacterium]|nr:hypothetical protein [Deltaproteobacteria bacterium]
MRGKASKSLKTCVKYSSPKRIQNRVGAGIDLLLFFNDDGKTMARKRRWLHTS